MVILTFGSSTTMGQWDENGGWSDRLRDFMFHKAASTNFKEYIDAYNLGVDADNSERLLKRFENEIQARSYSTKDIIIFIAIGLNDSMYLADEKHNWIQPHDFENNLYELINISKKYKAHLVLLGLTPVDSRMDPIPWKTEASYKMEYIQEYNEIIKRVCTKKNLPFIDILSKFMEGDISKYLQEGLHPNDKGHELIYSRVKEYLLKEKMI